MSRYALVPGGQMRRKSSASMNTLVGNDDDKDDENEKDNVVASGSSTTLTGVVRTASPTMYGGKEEEEAQVLLPHEHRSETYDPDYDTRYPYKPPHLPPPPPSTPSKLRRNRGTRKPLIGAAFIAGIFIGAPLFARGVSFVQQKVVFGHGAQSILNTTADMYSDGGKGGMWNNGTGMMNTGYSKNVSGCPGYTLSSLRESSSGLTAHLNLAGPPCNAFGHDIFNLTIQVTYEAKTRLHVEISDTSSTQFRIPQSVLPLQTSSSPIPSSQSDLTFNYESNPFAFWITRRSAAPDDTPLFDTRPSSLPPTPIPPVIPSDASTALDSFALIFEDRYIQIASALPFGANVYGLGEVVAGSGFRRETGADEDGRGTIQTMWARDAPDPVDENIYGAHPFYLEHRYSPSTGRSSSHGVLLFSSAPSDILLLTPPQSTASLLEYRLLGGVLDFYFFSGPTPLEVVEQYGEVVGRPAWVPYWGFGFQLCRWGYQTVEETREQVRRMREAGVPLEVIWNDIDLYLAYRDFTTDSNRFPAEEMREFIRELAENNQHYIPIVDAGIAKTVNSSDIYDPYTRGVEQDVFIKNPDGSEFVGQVWPGYTVFPDWFANNSQAWWTEALRNWSIAGGVEFSGIWLDMNEVASFCDGSCGSGIDVSDTSTPFPLPGTPGNLISEYPEGYDAEISGPSGNITVNGQNTFDASDPRLEKLYLALSKSDPRSNSGPVTQTNTNMNGDPYDPPYTIHNGNGALSSHSISPNATHVGGITELDVHNLFGLMEEKATFEALLEIRPGKRPFLISRSTFPGSGRWSGHWLGDNLGQWNYMYDSIQGVLQFQLFQIPMVGADTCGFIGNTNEELCNRWMQLSAFHPFYRNHNILSGLPQEPYRWDSVAEASRTAIAIRYSLLPYWYTLFATASLHGTPPVRALWMEFPDEPELFDIDSQFLVGPSILVTPVLRPNASTVDGIFPGQGKVTWRDWYTHDVVHPAPHWNSPITLSGPLGHIPIHIRSGSAILLHQNPAYTTEETRNGPFSLLISLNSDRNGGGAFGTAYIDDGESYPPGPSTILTIAASAKTGSVSVQPEGSFQIQQRLQMVTVLGIAKKPAQITVNGRRLATRGWEWLKKQEKLVVKSAGADLNEAVTISWQ